MSTLRNSWLCGVLLALVCMPAGAIERLPAQSCAIIHATYVAKLNAGQLKGVAKYCKKFNPFVSMAVNTATRNMIASSLATRSSALAVSSNNKARAVAGSDFAACDDTIEVTFPKLPLTQTFFTDYLDSQIEFCDDWTF